MRYIREKIGGPGRTLAAAATGLLLLTACAAGDDDSDARETIQQFWEIQQGRDYTALVELFADDATLVDPIYGTYQGVQGVQEFMTLMNEEMAARDTNFTLVEIAGDGEVAWAQWVAHTPRGDLEGVGVYRVEDGEITYYRDYMNPPQTRPGGADGSAGSSAEQDSGGN